MSLRMPGFDQAIVPGLTYLCYAWGGEGIGCNQLAILAKQRQSLFATPNLASPIHTFSFSGENDTISVFKECTYLPVV